METNRYKKIEQGLSLHKLHKLNNCRKNMPHLHVLSVPPHSPFESTRPIQSVRQPWPFPDDPTQFHVFASGRSTVFPRAIQPLPTAPRLLRSSQAKTLIVIQATHKQAVSLLKTIMCFRKDYICAN